MSRPTFEQIPEYLLELHQMIAELTAIVKQNTENLDKVEKLINIDEASEFLNLSVSRIYTKVSKREIPFMKKSKRLYFSKSELLEYIKEGRKSTQLELKNKQQLKGKRNEIK